MFLGQEKDLFKEEVIGSFGNFKTTDSQELYYLMATLRVDQLGLLNTASETLDFHEVSFEEMVQRDIDYGRVDNEIIKDYLEKGKERSIFFPPLLVSLMSFDKKAPISQYDNIVDDIKDVEGTRSYVKEWGTNCFKLELPLSNSDTGYNIQCDKDKETYSYYNYAAKIKYNPISTKLVVIDGQHRLSALKRIKDPSLLNGMKIPICLFFSPNITKGQQESSKDSMRELFVTINNTSKQVGGHFLKLLNDKSISSLAVRALANKWKQKDEGLNHLHFLEWNQRESKLSHQRTRKYAITTISIIADAVKEFVINSSCVQMLNLSEVDSELKLHSLTGDSKITEDEFSKAQIPSIDQQIEKYITPSLSALFTEIKPYNNHIKIVLDAYKNLTTKIDDKIHGAETFHNDVLMQFRETTKYDEGNVRDIEESFNSDIIEKSEDKDQFYFRNVFQTGLIKAWSILSRKLVVEVEKSPSDIANALTKSLNVGLFASEKDLFSPLHSYTQNILFNGQKIVVNNNSKTQISNLIIASLEKNNTIELFIETLNIEKAKENELKTILTAMASNAKKSYIDSFEDNIVKKIKKTYRFMDFDESDIELLEHLEKKSLKGEKEDIEKYHAKIDEFALDKKDFALKVLNSVLLSRK